MSALQKYLDRIGFDGAPQANPATLKAVHRAHALAVPFENIDVQLGRPATTDVGAAFEKIVNRGRGGWCFEQNGLFGWALEEIGFRVTRVGGQTMRPRVGDAPAPDHLVLLVETPEADGPWLADVGFGGSMLTPVKLAAKAFAEPPFQMSLALLEDGCWRFSEDMGDGPFSFDFSDGAVDETALSAKCSQLQDDPSSHFVLNLSVQKRGATSQRILRGRVYTLADGGGRKRVVLDTPDALVSTLKTEFGLDTPEIADQWPKICARHEEIAAAVSESAGER